jgi:hypothetical protein
MRHEIPYTLSYGVIYHHISAFGVDAAQRGKKEVSQFKGALVCTMAHSIYRCLG